MKSKTSYYVCPNYFIHKKEHSLILCSFLFSFNGNYITKVQLLYKQRAFKAYLCTIADQQFEEREQHFLSDFSAKNSLYTIFSLIERRFPQFELSLWRHKELLWNPCNATCMPTSEGHSSNTSLKVFLILYSSTRSSVHSRYESPLQVAVMSSSVRQFQYTSNALKKGYNEDVSSA